MLHCQSCIIYIIRTAVSISILGNFRSVSQSAVSSVFVTTLAQLLSFCYRVTSRCLVLRCLSGCDISSPAAMSGIQTEQSHLSRQSPGSSFLHEALKISTERRVQEETPFSTLLSALLTRLKSTVHPVSWEAVVRLNISKYVNKHVLHDLYNVAQNPSHSDIFGDKFPKSDKWMS